MSPVDDHAFASEAETLRFQAIRLYEETRDFFEAGDLFSKVSSRYALSLASGLSPVAADDVIRCALRGRPFPFHHFRAAA